MKNTALFLILAAGFLFNSTVTFAQSNAFDAANSYTISGSNIQEGVIISHNGGQFKVSSEAYDKNMFGVLVMEPALEYIQEANSEKYPVVKAGIAVVRVSGANGPINTGDRVTSSDIEGVGMKASKSGFTVGIAQASFSGTQASQQGSIPVAVDIQFTFADDSPASETIGTRLLDVIKLNTIATIESPTTVMRYSLASVSVLSALIMSFFTFTRTAQKGIEAIGRNPLAKSAISTSVLLNTGISIIIIAAGVAVAYFIVSW